MIRINCPFCGLRDHQEFTYLEDGSVKIPPLNNTSEKKWYEFIFLRDNPRGKHIEKWHHVHGCRMILIVTRDTTNHKITKVEPANKNFVKYLNKKKEI